MASLVGFLFLLFVLLSLLFVLLHSSLLQHLLNELGNRPLPLFGLSLLELSAHGLLDNFAVMLLNVLADFLSAGMALVLPDGLTFGWTGMALGLPLLDKLDFAKRMGDIDAFLPNFVGPC